MANDDAGSTANERDEPYFEYRTRGGLSGAGKPVCYVVLPEPQGDSPEECFSSYCAYRIMVITIIKNILSQADCVVVHKCLDGGDAPWDDTQHLIESSQLVVPIVNKRFVETPDSRARHEAVYAQQRGISLLPITLEPGLDVAFEQVLGKIQYIPCFDLGFGTEHGRSFAEHLGDRVQVLLGSTLDFDSTWNAFPVHMFVSYRKKNREHVRTIVSKIDGVRSLRGMAVWYDEFLVSGERYDDDIDRRLRESDLVLLVVTPDLLEAGNYVLTIEYKIAIEEGKLILPILMSPTDRKELHDKYPNLPTVLEDVSGDAIEDAILSLLGTSIPEPTSADQANLQGMAYLSGMLVERNDRVAVDLLQAASNGGSLAATDKLVEVYTSSYLGFQDFEESISLRERGIVQAGAQNDVDVTDIRNRYRELANCFILANQPDKALATAERALKFIRRNRSSYNNRNGYIATLTAAQSYLGEMYELVHETGYARNMYENSYRMLHKATRELSHEALLKRGFITARDMWAFASDEMLESLLYCLGPLIELNRAVGDDIAVAAQMSDFNAAQSVLEERRGGERFAEISLRALYGEANELYKQHRFEEAKEKYRELVELANGLISGELVSFGVLLIAAKAKRSLALIAVEQDDYSRALEHFEDELSRRKQCYEMVNAHDSRMDLATAYANVFKACCLLGMQTESFEHYESSALQHLKAAEHLGSNDQGILVEADLIRLLRDTCYELGDISRWKMRQIELTRVFLERSRYYANQLLRLRSRMTFDDCMMSARIEDDIEACYRKLGWDIQEYVRRGDEAAVQKLRWLCRAALLKPEKTSYEGVREWFKVKTDSAMLRQADNYNIQLCIALFEEMSDVINHVVTTIVQGAPLDDMFGIGIVGSFGYACKQVAQAMYNRRIVLSGLRLEELVVWTNILREYVNMATGS